MRGRKLSFTHAQVYVDDVSSQVIYMCESLKVRYNI